MTALGLVLVLVPKHLIQQQTMANNIVAELCFAGNARQSRSRGAYGRPKTRSPFPSTSFVAGGIPRQSRKPQQAVHNGVRWAKGEDEPQRSLHTDMCVVGNSQMGKNKLREITAPQPAPERVRAKTKNPRLKLTAQLQLHPHEHFSSITQECINALPAVEPQAPAEKQKARANDVESSYKLTFYNPSAIPKAGHWIRPTQHNHSAASPETSFNQKPGWDPTRQR